MVFRGAVLAQMIPVRYDRKRGLEKYLEL